MIPMTPMSFLWDSYELPMIPMIPMSFLWDFYELLMNQMSFLWGS